MKYLFLVVLQFPLLLLSQNNFQRAEDYFLQERFKEAKPLFLAYLDENPRHKQTREYLGDIAGHGRDWDVAISYYKGLKEDDNTNANYHFKYGGAMGMKALEISRLRALTYIFDIKEAFENAVKLDPNHIEARWALVEYYIQLPGIVGGSEQKAIAHANELGRISEVDGYLANGYIAEYYDRAADAENYYKKAIEVGGSPHTYEKLSHLYENNDRPKEAIDVNRESLEIHRRNQLNYQIGKIAAQYDLEPEIGIKCLLVYLKNYSIGDGVPKEWAYYRLAQIHNNEGTKESALQWIDKALNERPDFAEAMSEKNKILGL